MLCRNRHQYREGRRALCSTWSHLYSSFTFNAQVNIMEQTPEMPCAMSRLPLMGKIKVHTQCSLLYRKHLETSQQLKISLSYVCSFHCTQLCCTNLWSNDDTPRWLNQCSFPDCILEVHFALYTCDYVSDKHQSVAVILTWLYAENYKEQVRNCYC